MILRDAKTAAVGKKTKKGEKDKCKLTKDYSNYPQIYMVVSLNNCPITSTTKFYTNYFFLRTTKVINDIKIICAHYPFSKNLKLI